MQGNSHGDKLSDAGFLAQNVAYFARALRRAGLDYHEFVAVSEHADLQECLNSLDTKRVFALTTKGRRSFFDVQFRSGDAFLLGPETRGLPAQLLESLESERVLRLPMRPERVRPSPRPKLHRRPRRAPTCRWDRRPGAWRKRRTSM